MTSAAITVSPDNGMTGESITITGTGFSGSAIAANSIKIGGVAGVHSAVTITATNFTATVTFGDMVLEGLLDIAITPTGQSEVTFTDKVYFSYYTSIDRVRNLANANEDNLADAAINQFIIDREREIDAWYMNDNKPRPKSVFGYGSETSEYCCYRRGDGYIRTLYPFIIAVSSLYFRSGNSAWDTMTEGVDNDFYADTEDKRRGRIGLGLAPYYEKDGVKVSYTHGYTAIPPEISGLCTKMAALDALHALLQTGEDDVYDQRIPALRDQIQSIKDSIGQRNEAVIF